MKVSELFEYAKLSELLSKEDKFLNIVCPNASAINTKIYRGFPQKSKDLLFGDSSKYIRKSAHTENYYTILIDHILQKWKDYPKRSRSFICTSNVGKAKIYGTIYRVFPEKNPIIGICPNQDIWDSFKNTNNFYISDMFGDLYQFFNKSVSDKLPNIVNLINITNKSWRNKKIQEIMYTTVVGYKNFPTFKNFTEFLEYLLDPERNGFKLIHLSELDNLKLKDNEIWFSGPAYFKSIQHGDDYGL